MTRYPSAKRRAHEGALLEDQLHPGWANEIDLEVFDIRNGSHCIIGQTEHTEYSDAIDGVAEMFTTLPEDGLWYQTALNTWAMENGFLPLNNILGDPDFTRYSQDWQTLNRAWRKEILARRSAGVTAPA